MQNRFCLHIVIKQEFNLVDCCIILWNFGFSFWYFALLQCFFNVVLCCCSDVALQWYGTAMLKCCCAKVLQSIGVILNWCCSCSELVLKWIGAAVNWCCSAWVLQCIGAAVIWYCNAKVFQFYINDFLGLWEVLGWCRVWVLQCWSAALLWYCSAMVLQCCCDVV